MPYSSHTTGWLLWAAAALCAGCEIRDQSPAAHNVGQASDQDEGLSRGRIAFVDGFERGHQIARQQQKPMLIFFTAQWCKYCHQMANETFIQDAVVSLSRHFVCVLIDADAEPDVCRQFEVRSFPTVQFVSPRGVRLNRVVGKHPAHQLIAQMQAALQTLARRPELTLPR